MPNCNNCGSEVNHDASFCNKCGNKIEIGKTVQAIPAKTPEYVPPMEITPPPTSPIGYGNQNVVPSSNKSKLWLTLFIIALVILVTVGSILGLSYASASNQLKSTKDTLATTQEKATSLQDDLTSSEGKLADVNSTLASTKGVLASTQQTLASTQGELTSTKTQLDSTQSQLSTSQSALTSAQNQMSSISSQLASSQTMILTLQNQLAASKIKYFTNLSALTAWLNTQPLFNTTYIYDDSVQLQNRALDQGYYLVANMYNDTNGTLYGGCQAYCSDGNVYLISPRTHDIWVIAYEGIQPTP